MPGIGKQAKTLRPREYQRLLDYVSHGRYPERDRVMVLLSFKAGMRAKEIAALTWAMVTDASGEVTDEISLPNIATKGDGGRRIPIHPDLKAALISLRALVCVKRINDLRPNERIIYSERGPGYSANAVAVWFHIRYREAGIQGASSHSGRRTFITNAARSIAAAGGSLRDVQQLAGHSSLTITQRYIDGNPEAKRKVVEMI